MGTDSPGGAEEKFGANFKECHRHGIFTLFPLHSTSYFPFAPGEIPFSSVRIAMNEDYMNKPLKFSFIHSLHHSTVGTDSHYT